MRSVQPAVLTVSLILVTALSAAAGILHTHPGQQNNREIRTSIVASDPEEQQFQEYVDALFTSASKGDAIDTSGWCTYRINCAKHDFRFMYDTLFIPLTDSTLSRRFTYPLRNFVTSSFGPRKQFWHFGTDIQVMYRDTIHAVFDGIVRVVANDRYGYGNVVVVRHHYGLETLYGHLSRSHVKVNQVVKSGDAIGLGGRTGRATGRHLHFEIRFCGEPFDPATILNTENYTLKSDTLALTREHFSHILDLRNTLVHTIRKGDNLGRIARKYGTTIHRLCTLNGITRTSILKIGRRLIIRKASGTEDFTAQGKTARNDS